MVIFICKRSGNKLEVSNINDIIATRKHECYKEVKNDVQIEEIKEAPKKEIITIASVKKRGRPIKSK